MRKFSRRERNDVRNASGKIRDARLARWLEARTNMESSGGPLPRNRKLDSVRYHRLQYKTKTQRTVHLLLVVVVVDCDIECNLQRKADSDSTVSLVFFACSLPLVRHVTPAKSVSPFPRLSIPRGVATKKILGSAFVARIILATFLLFILFSAHTHGRICWSLSRRRNLLFFLLLSVLSKEQFSTPRAIDGRR